MSLVKIKREEAGLTMSQVAKRANMLLTRLWKIEHGQRKLRVDEVAILAKAIGCKPSELIPTIPTPDEEEPAHVV